MPDVQMLLLPVLEHVRDGEPHRPADTLASIVSKLPLTEEDLSDRVPSGRTRLMDRTLWAITYLRKAKLIESLALGVFQITERGRALLAENPRSLSSKHLERFPEFLEFRRGVRPNTGKAESVNTEALQETPADLLERAYGELRTALEQELLERIKAASPIFFEKLVLNLIVAMGYGGSLEDAGQTTKKSGDDGIDGVVKEDRLGLDVIHIQAKRWNTAVVGRPDVQSFAGSLEGQRGKKGVFITTSTFSNEAREYVSRIEKKIVLIDGPQLSRLCVDFGIGVSVESTYIAKKLNEDFFEDL